MVRNVIVAIGTLMVLVAMPFAPHAAAEGDQGDGQTVVTLGGKLRCLFSPNNIPRGGGPMAVCEQSDGQPLGSSPWSTAKYPVRLGAALVHGDGQFYWAEGGISPMNEVVGSGQTVHVDGWTIEDQGLRARITNDFSGHGILISQYDVRGF
jgi:hypothetical protein